MATGSSSETLDRANNRRGSSSEHGSEPPNNNSNNVEPFVPKRDHDPRDLRSWAKRTGFVSMFSGETAAAGSSRNFENGKGGSDLEKGVGERGSSLSPKIEIDPILGRTKAEIEPSGNGLQGNRNAGELGLRNGNRDEERRFGLNGNASVLDSTDEERNVGLNGNANGNGHGAPEGNVAHHKTDEVHGFNEEFHHASFEEEPILGGSRRTFEVKCGVADNPGFATIAYYGFQHYLSLVGSLVLIPLVTVPLMGGTDKDTANVISTVLLVSGIATILHSYFGTRLPLVQGSSFVYLAPALVVMNSQEFRNLTEHKFRYIMRELQGAIIIGSLFQSLLGFSGLVALLLRLINPIVIAPTIAAVGLAFFSYGFPQAGTCIEISIPLIVLVIIFTLPLIYALLLLTVLAQTIIPAGCMFQYVRGISISGHRVFQIYAVPLSIAIVWVYAFFLTAGGAYNFKGCSPNIPSSNILVDTCKKHAYTMRHCRTDASNAWRTSAWVRIPYPLQWGVPIFHFRTSIVMIIVSLVSSIDSVGTYYSASLRVNSKPPTPGIVTRGIGMEGFCSLLAGLWGTGSGSTTLTENVHTINITKVANRRGLQVGAVLLILFSFIGKVGGILASIPPALAASVLCFIWALTVALGLLNLQYTQASSFRNMGIVGVSLFLGLSVPAYFQQFDPQTNLILPSYLVPYAAASSGPVHTGNSQLDFAVNGLLSMNMVVTFLIAFVLDNTVPGSKQERGVYKWSTSEDLANDPSSEAIYRLPNGVTSICCWAKCLDV